MTRRSRTAYLAATALAALLIGGISVTDVTPRLIWNASASVPLGLYALRPTDTFTVGDLVAVDPPKPLASFITERGYVSAGVPLLKHVVALPGQRVCRSGSTITIDEAEVAEALPQDSIGRDLPVWQGCRILKPGEVFLLNAGVGDSLDGRYFGPLPTHSIIGRAIPLWTDDEHPGSARSGAEAAQPSH